MKSPDFKPLYDENLKLARALQSILTEKIFNKKGRAFHVMEAATYIGLSYQTGLQRQMDVIANNIANVSTPGFKSRNVMFDSYVNDPKGVKEEYLSVNDFGEYVDTAQGAITPSGRPLDIALEGPGYFGVITGDGVKYSRAGHLSLNSIGEVVTPNGMRIADSGGAPITVPEGTSKITIGNNGAISADGNVAGEMMLREFTNINDVRPIGNNLYESDVPPLEIEEGSTRVLQGFIESSNVNSIKMTTDLMEASRKYTDMQRMLQGENDRVRDMISRVGRQK